MSPARLTDLPAWSEEGALHVVVESPRGSGLKLKYEPELGTFMLSRALPVGLTYPFDWGFVPGTRGEDGDPLDALVLSDVPSFPGVLIACRPVALVQVSQRKKKGRGRERNDRLIAVPVGEERLEDVKDLSGLSRRIRRELERFFLATTQFTQKDAQALGWRGAAFARRFVRDGQSRS